MVFKNIWFIFLGNNVIINFWNVRCQNQSLKFVLLKSPQAKWWVPYLVFFWKVGLGSLPDEDGHTLIQNEYVRWVQSVLLQTNLSHLDVLTCHCQIEIRNYFHHFTNHTVVCPGDLYCPPSLPTMFLDPLLP